MPTTNPVPSNDPTDLLFNAQKLDEVVSGSAQYYTDRLGANRRTVEGISAAADVVLSGLGYAPPVTYAAGISLTLTTQTIEYAGEVYAPKVASLPFTTSTWATDSAKFRLIQGVAATDLAASGGAAMIGYMPAGTGAVPTTVQSKQREMVSARDFGAIGDGNSHPLSERFATLSAAQAVYPHATSLTNEIDGIAIQAGLNTGKDIFCSEYQYVINVPLYIGSQRLKGGIGLKVLNRPQSKITVVGNIPCFYNSDGEPSFEIDGFYIYYSDTTPTVATGNDQKIAFKFTTNGLWPAYFHIKNCTISGAWYGYYDDTGTYLSKLTQIACRNTRIGFYKVNGTTISFDTCSSSGGIQGFNIQNVLSPILTNCSADGLAISSASPSNTGNLFKNIASLTINGWDGEVCTISGHTSSYMRFESTTGVMSGFTGVSNTLIGAAGDEVYFMYCAYGTYMTFIGFKPDREANWLVYSGTGGQCFTLNAYSGSKATIIGSDFGAPTGGSPTTRYSVAGVLSSYIGVINSIIDNSSIGVGFNLNDDAVYVGGSLAVPNGPMVIGTSAPIPVGSQFGGFGSEKVTIQSGANTAVFSTTASTGSGVSAEFARGNDGAVQYFFRNGSAVGHIDVSTGATTYATSSDYRLKTDVQPMANALEKVMLLRPVTYRWKENGNLANGFIAHELQTVEPQAVTGSKDKTRIETYEISPAVLDAEGNIEKAAVLGEREVPDYQGVDATFLVATLTAAIQELKSEFDAYKASGRM